VLGNNDNIVLIDIRKAGKRMKWIPEEVETYLKAMEYVDTAVVPLISLSFREEMKQSAAKHQFITLLTTHMERQFTGRILLFPSFTYLKSGSTEKVINELKEWEENIEKSNFKHIFYLTSESDWKIHEQQLNGTILWLPAIPLESVSDSQKLSLIDSQVNQLLTLFMQKWNENSEFDSN
jgi:hypothetical protein